MTSKAKLVGAPVTAKTTVLVPVGSLGVGVRVEEVQRGIAAGANVIALDAGSTDSGAAYLATGVAKYNREAVKRDLRILMAAQAEARIPLLIGSCGQSGRSSVMLRPPKKVGMVRTTANRRSLFRTRSDRHQSQECEGRH